MPDPELQARQNIDAQLELAGWHVCDFGDHDISMKAAVLEPEWSGLFSDDELERLGKD